MAKTTDERGREVDDYQVDYIVRFTAARGKRSDSTRDSVTYHYESIDEAVDMAAELAAGEYDKIWHRVDKENVTVEIQQTSMVNWALIAARRS